MSKEKIRHIIDTLIAEWPEPKVPPRMLAEDPDSHFLCECTAEKATEMIVDDSIPQDVLDFWSLYKRANLFLEIESYLSGLILLSYDDAKSEIIDLSIAPYSEFEVGDLFIGHFMCYPDRLVVRCDPRASDFGTIFVAIYNGFRSEWYRVADNFTEFLERFVNAEGEHYW